jgi:hypothetical protein
MLTTRLVQKCFSVATLLSACPSFGYQDKLPVQIWEDGQLVRIWKEVITAYFKILSWHSPGKTKENNEIRIAKFLNWVPPEYKCRVLLLHVLHSFQSSICNNHVMSNLIPINFVVVTSLNNLRNYKNKL